MNVSGVSSAWSSVYQSAGVNTARKNAITGFAEKLEDAMLNQNVLTADAPRTSFGHLAEAPDRNKYFRLANADDQVIYNGVVFCCDYEKNRLTLGDCSNPDNCIRVGLAGGGSLMVNRENIGDLKNALSMFTYEDIGRILRAIEVDKMAQEREVQLEETSDDAAIEAKERTDDGD